MIRTKFVVAALIAGCSLTAMSASAHAQEASRQPVDGERQTYNIPAQPLETALNTFAEISGSDLLYASSLVAGKQSAAIRGSYTASEALRLLIGGTGLTTTQVSENVFSLRAQAERSTSDGTTSPVGGLVRSSETGAPVPGAKVEVVGSELETTTDGRGFFYFPQVPPTATELRVTYLGEPTAVFPLPDSLNERTRLTIAFGEDQGDGILVRGYLSSIQRSLNQQLRAPNNSTVVSADQLGGFPAENIAEALRRVPGVGFGRDAETGEGSRITIRGFSSEAINVQLNGVELQGTSFDRTVDLSGFLTENLSEVTIHKSLLPSHEATGSGGLVEIETKSALDYGDFSLNLNAEGEFSTDRDFGEEYQLNGTLAKTLTDNFGIVGTFQYRNTDRTNVDSRVSDIIPPVLPEGQIFFSRIRASTEFPFDPDLPQQLLFGSNFIQRDRQEETYTGSIGLAWDVSDHTRLRLDVQRNVRDVVALTTNNTFLASTPAVNMPIAELGGEVRRRETLSNLRANYTIEDLDNRLTTDTISFRGDTTIGRWDFEYRAGYTRATEKGNNSRLTLQGDLNTDIFNLIDPSSIVTAPDTNGNLRVIDGAFVFAPNGLAVPSLSAAGQAAIVDPAQFNILIATRNLIDNKTESFNFELQTRYSPATDFIEYIEVGALYRPTERNTIDAATNPRNSNIESYVRRLGQEISIGEIDSSLLGTRELGIVGLPDFTVASIDPSILPRAFDAIRAAGDARFTVTDRTGLDPILDAAAFDPTTTIEDKWAGYLETQFNFGDFDLIAGVRYERQSRSNQTIIAPSIRTGPGIAGAEPRETFLDAGLIGIEEVSGTVDSWTPSFLLNYRPASNLVARLGYFRSTVNPDISLLNRTQRIIADLRPGFGRVTLFLPNPDLRPTITDNLDLDLAYYFEDTVGLVRAGFFYKNVKNNFTNVLFENGDGSGVRAAYEDFFAPLATDRPDLFVFPDGTEFVLNQPVNGEGGEIYGFEFEVIRELDFLPGFLSDFGIVGNATYTTADFPTLVSARDDDDQLVQLALDRPLRDQAEWVYNASLTYNNDGFDAVVIYTYQSASAEAFDEFNINTVVPSFDTLDARFAYTFDRGPGRFTLYLEGDNLLQSGSDAEVRSTTSSQFGDGAASFNFPQLYQFNGGRTITAGVRAIF